MELAIFAVAAVILFVIIIVVNSSNDDGDVNDKGLAEENAQKEWNDFLKRCELLINSHQNALYRNRRNLIAVDDYGVVDASAWVKEISYFYENIILKDEEASLRLKRMEWFYSSIGKNINKEFVFEQVFDVAEKILHEVHENRIKNEYEEQLFEDEASGRDYEIYCADILERDGWDVRHPPATGDQGVDLIAEIDGARVVIQCKLYSKPVGNAAVQEVVAGQMFYEGDYAVVVSNNSFTLSAKNLAKSSNVILLHHDQLKDLRAIISNVYSQ